jgi:hypothetical protein
MVDLDEDKNTLVICDKAYIKLTKNTKGYNWDIKVYKLDTDEEMLRIKAVVDNINNKMFGEYGIT